MLAPRILSSRALFARRALVQPVIRRTEATYQAPKDPEASRKERNRQNHRNFYKVFGRPIARNFLIAVATYQVLYFSWLKLQSMETIKDGEEEIRQLEGELQRLSDEKKKEFNKRVHQWDSKMKGFVKER